MYDDDDRCASFMRVCALVYAHDDGCHARMSCVRAAACGVSLCMHDWLVWYVRLMVCVGRYMICLLCMCRLRACVCVCMVCPVC